MALRGLGGASRQLNRALLAACLLCALPSCRGLRLQEERRRLEEQAEAEAGDICVWKSESNHSKDQASNRYQKVFDLETDLHAKYMEHVRDWNRPEEDEISLLDVGRRVPCNLTRKEKYLMIISAFEQFGGARQVLGDAVALAKALNRTFVEPVIRNGRVANPFYEKSWVPLSEMLDVDSMKRYWPHWISIKDFLSACDPANGLPPMEVFLRKEAMSNRTIQDLSTVKQKIVALSHFMRKGNGHFSNKSVDGVPLEPSKWIAKTAKNIMQMLDPRVEANGYICAHWRSEGALDKKDEWESCAEAFQTTVHKVMKCHLWQDYWPKVFLLSDLRNDTSDTIHGQALRSQYAVELDRRLHHHQVGWALEQIKDHGQRALVEQYICSRARIMVGCPYDRMGKMCGNCSRVQSKFAMQIMSMREELGMPRAINW